jgi:hypothetical protein
LNLRAKHIFAATVETVEAREFGAYGAAATHPKRASIGKPCA